MRRGLAIGLVLLGLLGIVGIFACNESVEGWLSSECERSGTERDPNGNRAERFRCPKPASRIAADLAEAHKPADRRSTPEGHFLRYADDMVGIVSDPDDAERSIAYISDERRGYGFFFPFVGGFWGSYTGPGERFRGGGPGGGK
jgi:hypothetical protein